MKAKSQKLIEKYCIDEDKLIKTASKQIVDQMIDQLVNAEIERENDRLTKELRNHVENIKKILNKYQ